MKYKKEIKQDTWGDGLSFLVACTLIIVLLFSLQIFIISK